MSKPITLYGHNTGPNPWKVAIILEELKIPYEHKLIELSSTKLPPYLALNINSRVPTIVDPNTNTTLWESGAIIEYLISVYDKNNTFTYIQGPNVFLLKQWLHFQMSGQGPYFGQAAWFWHFHAEKVDSAKNRYREQVFRVLGVLDKQLEGRDWLVGDKCTFADLSFVTWDAMVPWIFGHETPSIEKEYPNYYAWNERLLQRDAVKKTLKDKAAASTH